MKKSKEYFTEMKEALDTLDEKIIQEKVVSIFKEFFYVEISELIKTRNAVSNSAGMAIFREQNQKWNSLCDKCEAVGCTFLKRDAIKILVEKKITDGKPV